MLSELLLPLVLLAAYGVFVWYLWREKNASAWAVDERAAAGRLPQPGRRERVLYVCTHNSARSQMAEALLRARAGRLEVASAGTSPTRVHPLAEQAMTERGLTLAGHRAKSLAEAGTDWDHVITVCDAAYENCPDFPMKTSRLHWSVKDPAQATGSVDEQLAAFRAARDDLAHRIERWLAERIDQ